MITRLVCALVILIGFTAPGQTAVTITFYSHKMARADGLNFYFTHGFVTLSGVMENGTLITTNLGFTAKTTSLDVLWAKVPGELDPIPMPPQYIAGAQRHFSFRLTDDRVRAVLTVADLWSNAPQPSYDIDSHNCVTFLGDVAVAAGLRVPNGARSPHIPDDYLEEIAADNTQFLAMQGMRFAVTPMGPPGLMENRVQEIETQARQSPHSN